MDAPTTEIMRWLAEMRYPNLAQEQEALSMLMQGDLASSLVWLARHARGRREVAHIKSELHQLRQDAPSTLSVPRRQDLGLDGWETTVQAFNRLRSDGSRAAEKLEEVAEQERTAATTQARLLDDSLHQRILLSDLKHLEKTADRQRARVEALTTMVREWRSSFNESMKEASAAQETSKTLELLQGTPETGLENLTSPPATQAFLSDLVDTLARANVRLKEHVERHQVIRPPLIDNLEELLFTLRREVLDNFAPNTTHASESADERDILVTRIAGARRRRAALDQIASVLGNGPSSGESAAEDSVAEMRAQVNQSRARVEDLLKLRSSLRTGIKALSAEVSNGTLNSVIVDLDSARSTALKSLDSSKTAALARFEHAQNENATVPVVEEIPFLEIQQALQTSHLLAISPPAPPPLPASKIDEVCDKIASTRFALEALRPALELELEKPLLQSELEEAVRLNGLVDRTSESRALAARQVKEAKQAVMHAGTRTKIFSPSSTDLHHLQAHTSMNASIPDTRLQNLVITSTEAPATPTSSTAPRALLFPSKILAQIFRLLPSATRSSHLFHASLVCRAWYCVTFHFIHQHLVRSHTLTLSIWSPERVHQLKRILSVNRQIAKNVHRLVLPALIDADEWIKSWIDLNVSAERRADCEEYAWEELEEEGESVKYWGPAEFRELAEGRAQENIYELASDALEKEDQYDFILSPRDAEQAFFDLVPYLPNLDVVELRRFTQYVKAVPTNPGRGQGQPRIPLPVDESPRIRTLRLWRCSRIFTETVRGYYRFAHWKVESLAS